MNQEYQRFLKRYERKFTPVIYRAIKQQVDEYLRTNDLNSIKSEPIFKALEKLYLESGSIWAAKSDKQIRRALRLPRTEGGFGARIGRLIREQYGPDILNMSENITQTTKDRIQTLLKDAVNTQLSIFETSQLIRAEGVTEARSRVIARTETIRASNAAAEANAKDKGYIIKKKWFAAMDNRTRHDHKKLDGQVVDLYGYFSVTDKNGVRQNLGFPGDTSLGADPAETINCRCSLQYVTK